MGEWTSNPVVLDLCGKYTRLQRGRCTMKSSPRLRRSTSTSTIWSAVQMFFVAAVIAGSERMRTPGHHVESPADACSKVFQSARARAFGGSALCCEPCLHFSVSSLARQSPSVTPPPPCTTVRMSWSRRLQLSYWNITVHSTNRPGSVICPRMSRICQSNCS